MRAKAKSGKGAFKLKMSCSDWGTKDQKSTLAGSEKDVISHTFGAKEETVTGTYVAPNDEMAWFIQGSLEFADATDFDVTFFSIKRTQTSNITENFQVDLNGKTYAAGNLARFRTKEFTINPTDLADAEGVIKLKASIRGNHFGMAQLIYRGPTLMGRNARYKVNSVEGNTFDITLTSKLSGFENIFKMFPFSRKYGGIEVVSTDGAGEIKTSTNRNQWLTSDMTSLKRLRITYPTQAKK